MIGITGGVASGKSVVSHRLRSLGAVVLDADLFSKEAVNPHTPGWRKVKEAFPEVIQGDLSVDRRLLGQIIFADAQKRKVLEEIIHPEVLSRIQGAAQEAQGKGKIVFAEVPLLYEVGWDPLMEQTWVVYTSPPVQLERLIKRAQITQEQALQMMASQLPLKEKVKRATRVINNDGPLEQTFKQVDALWKELEREKKKELPGRQ